MKDSLSRRFVAGCGRVVLVWGIGSLIYFLALGPTVLVLRLFGRRPAPEGNSTPDSHWQPLPHR